MPRVFISYSHDSPNHMRRVFDFAGRLRHEEGIDCTIDQYESDPPEGWPRWMDRQIRESDYVLLICTETYLRRIQNDEAPGLGLGANWEGQLITSAAYRSAGHKTKFIPVLFRIEDAQFIPGFLEGTRFDVSTEAGHNALVARIKGVPGAIKPPLGPGRPLPPPREYSPAAVQEAGAAQSVARESVRGERALLERDGDLLLIRAGRIEERDGRITAGLYPANGHERAFLEELVPEWNRPEFWIGFGDTAAPVQADGLSRSRTANQEEWTLTLARGNQRGDVMMEMGTTGKSVDDIAELRARRILLDELAPEEVRRWSGSDPMLEILVQGSKVHPRLSRSPFIELYRRWTGTRDEFLETARLAAIVWLIRTSTVQHVLELVLAWSGESTLSVRFRGRRRKVYSNVPAREITFTGTCRLIEEPYEGVRL